MSEGEPQPLHLFEAVGIELEYMIVDSKTFDVRPIADQLMVAATGAYESEIERPEGVSWSNELVNHVVELKTTEPLFGPLSSAIPGFRRSVGDIDGMLKPLGARLMPGAMHPWMDPTRETRLWTHEYGEVYRNFDRLFDCRRHGWANLQSVHLNLPFHGDEEFGRLHAAIRLVLPLLPALCASSPIMDGRSTGLMCNRMDVYRSNQAAVPSLSGLVIPEAVFTQAEYERTIMEPIARDVAQLDASGVMRPEWMNSRGAIARFDRGSIEIRVMDVQECPAADVAIAAGVSAVLQWLIARSPSSSAVQRALSAEQLRAMLGRTIADAERATIDDRQYLAALGIAGGPFSASEIWRRLLGTAGAGVENMAPLDPLRLILDHGPLARRIADRLGGRVGAIERTKLRELAGELCDCLSEGRMLGASE